jgi:molybdenum cofactor cytidylyltransferase
MKNAPTIIVLVASIEQEAPQALAELDATLRQVLACGLPLIVIASGATATRARQLLPSKDVQDLRYEPRNGDDWLGRAVAAGVQATANANGWLLLPTDMTGIKPGTLRAMADNLKRGPMVYPQYRLRRGYPWGFASEMYSELIRLEKGRDLHRLAARYPGAAVDLDDPSVLDSRFIQPRQAPARLLTQNASMI